MPDGYPHRPNVAWEFVVLGEKYIIQCLEADEEGQQQVQVISHNDPIVVGPRKSPKHGAWSVEGYSGLHIAWHCRFQEGMETKVPVHEYERLCAYVDGVLKYTNAWKLTKKYGYPIDAKFMHTITPLRE